MKLQAMLKVLFATVSVSSLMLAACTPTQQVSSQIEQQVSSQVDIPVRSPIDIPVSSQVRCEEPASIVEVQQKSPVGSQPVKVKLDGCYAATSPEIVDRMLTLANLNEKDVLYDLGSGDGRIPIAAVKKYKVQKAVGIDLDPKRIKEANENAQKAGVTDKVQFLQQDLFISDLSNATVVTLFLRDDLNMRLRPRLLKLKPGTRIVSHRFDMGEWKPNKVEKVNGRPVYMWILPEKLSPYLQQTISSS
ncbi:MAG: methyltransferase domain-containing protein [Scytonema sp. PMC 1070.18]|nr:methyltransferase domain-containing protein [Scytonema sp. PMC 1070.18]